MMKELTDEQIVSGLQKLGLKKGVIVMVHSSLGSFGYVKGGADTVIDALLKTVGEEGTVMMPTFTARTERVFDPERTPSAMGIISETFRLKKGVIRSRHPYHPIAAYGPEAEELLVNHEKAPSPDGEGTPLKRLIEKGGYVLLLGVDQDRLTLLHTVEAELDLPYLRHLQMRYLDEEGREHICNIERCPGGHRGGVFHFDKLFREAGVMKIGKIGKCVARLMEARGIAAIMEETLTKDPTAALCNNYNCGDCTRYRGKLERARLDQEDFKLSAAAWEISPHIEEVMDVLEGEGINNIELDAEGLTSSAEAIEVRRKLERRGFEVSVLADETWTSLDVEEGRKHLEKLVTLADTLGVSYIRIKPPRQDQKENGFKMAIQSLNALANSAAENRKILLLENSPESYGDTSKAYVDLLTKVSSHCLRAAFNPANFVQMGESPLYGVLRRRPVKKFLQQLYITDAVFKGGAYVLPGQGNGEILEAISDVRCRSFSGFLCLRPSMGGGVDLFRKAARALWALMASL